MWYNFRRGLVDGLAYLHSKEILHNDLHSENILIRSDQSPCIIDLGKATLVEKPFVYNIVPGSKENKLHNNLCRCNSGQHQNGFNRF